MKIRTIVISIVVLIIFVKISKEPEAVAPFIVIEHKGNKKKHKSQQQLDKVIDDKYLAHKFKTYEKPEESDVYLKRYINIPLSQSEYPAHMQKIRDHAYQLAVNKETDKALVYLQGEPGGAQRMFFSLVFLHVLAQVDPKMAIAFAQASDATLTGFNDAQELSHIVTGWAVNDIQAASKWAGQLTMNDELHEIIVTALVDSWSVEEIHEALDWASGLEINKETTFTSLISKWGYTDIDEALEYYNNAPYNKQQEMLEGIMGPWANKKPEDFLKKNTLILNSDDSFKWGLTTAITKLSSSSPKTALEWLQNNPTQHKEELLEVVFVQAAQKDLKKTVELVETLVEEKDQLKAYGVLLPELVKKNHEAADEILEKVAANPQLQNITVSNIIKASPTHAQKLLWRISNVPMREHTCLQALESLSQNHQHIGKALIKTLPSGNFKNRSVLSLMKYSLTTNPENDILVWKTLLKNKQLSHLEAKNFIKISTLSNDDKQIFRNLLE